MKKRIIWAILYILLVLKCWFLVNIRVASTKLKSWDYMCRYQREMQSAVHDWLPLQTWIVCLYVLLHWSDYCFIWISISPSDNCAFRITPILTVGALDLIVDCNFYCLQVLPSSCFELSTLLRIPPLSAHQMGGLRFSLSVAQFVYCLLSGCVVSLLACCFWWCDLRGLANVIFASDWHLLWQ